MDRNNGDYWIRRPMLEVTQFLLTAIYGRSLPVFKFRRGVGMHLLKQLDVMVGFLPSHSCPVIATR